MTIQQDEKAVDARSRAKKNFARGAYRLIVRMGFTHRAAGAIMRASGSDLAVSAAGLALACESLVGRRQALEAIHKENPAGYGRARQQKGLLESIPGLQFYLSGEEFLAQKTARGVKLLLTGAETALREKGLIY